MIRRYVRARSRVCVLVWSAVRVYVLYLSPIGYKEDDTFRSRMINMAERKHAQLVKPIVNDVYESVGTRCPRVCASVKSRFLLDRFEL